jgi:hypothetical protein
MTLEELEAWLADWDLPLGPFKTIEDVFASMEARADALGPQEAGALAGLAAQFARNRHPRTNVLSIFLQKYAERHPDAFARSLLRELGPEGPPLLLDLLGSTGVRSAVSQAAKILDVQSATADLLIAWAGALGDLGGAEARAYLNELHARPDLDEEVKSEIRIGLERLESGRG